MGDFNTCLLKNDSRSSSLLSMLKSCNLNILPLRATHHPPNSIPTLLDLIFVSSLEHVQSHGQCAADELSYHDLIFLSYKVRPPKAKPRILMQRNFSGMNISSLEEDAEALDWSPIFSTTSVENQIDVLTLYINQLYDKHAPIRPIKLRHLPSPWLTDEIKCLIKRKAAAKSRYRSRPTDVNRDRYLFIRNHCNKVCRNAKRQHIHKSVENNDPAKVWKFLKSLGVGKQHQVINSSKLDINSLNKHFCASSNFDRTTKTNTLDYLSSQPTPEYPQFFFSQFTTCDVKKNVLAISSNAVGSDNISRNMILPILDNILPVICHILNTSITYGVFPSQWKDAQVTPLPKVRNPASFSDYRPISILPFLSKVLERLVHQQLNSFLYKNSLLNPFQSGFRPGHSTVTTLVNITDDIRSGMDNGMLTVLCLLDFSNAFNTVDFDVLISILGTLNISPGVIDWFRSYLFGRRQQIRLEDKYSTWSNICAGVPQGGVLSPLLFSIFINSISNDLCSSYHLYADDLQIYTQNTLETLPQAVYNINEDLSCIHQWTEKFGLTVNPGKTQAIIIGSSRLLSKVDWQTIPQVTFNNVIIPIKDSVKNLGIYIDNTLSWSAQLEAVSRKIFASAGSLRRLHNFLPIATKIALAQSILLPILDYADASYLDLNENQFDKLERLQNVCIRFIFGLRKYDHVSEFRTKLKWLPIRHRRNTHILNLLYNTLFNPTTPIYLKKRFTFLHDTHSRCLRSSENLRLALTAHSTNFFGKSFTIEAARLWNALPLNIKKAQSISSFNRLVKKHYLKLQAD